jgi:hypothetical protein
VTIKVHKAKNGTFIIEGLEKRKEPIPAFAMPGHIDPMTTDVDERSMEVVIPALRFAATLDKALELVNYRIGEGDLDPVIYGPGCMPARNMDGSDAVPPCEAFARIAKLGDHGFMVIANLAHARLEDGGLKAEDMESANGRDMARCWDAVRPMFVGMTNVYSVQTYAVGSRDDALKVLREFFGGSVAA